MLASALPVLTLALCTVLASKTFASPVETRSFSELQFYPEYSAPASVISAQDTLISAQLSARVSAIPVDLGDEVSEGALLVQLECAEYQAKLRSEQARDQELRSRVQLAERQYQRAVRLRQAGNLGEDLLEQRATDRQVLASQRALQAEAIELAQLSVDRCQVRAPFSGVIAERMVQLGQVASPGMMLLRLIQLEDASVDAQISTDLRWSENQEIIFQSDGGSYPLELKAQLPILDPTTRTRTVRFRFAEQSAPIGSVGRVVWFDEQPHLPSEYLVERRSAGEWVQGVLVERAGRVELVPLRKAVEGQPLAIDLPGQTQIITTGRVGLEPGETVSVEPDGDGGAD